MIELIAFANTCHHYFSHIFSDMWTLAKYVVSDDFRNRTRAKCNFEAGNYEACINYSAMLHRESTYYPEACTLKDLARYRLGRKAFLFGNYEESIEQFGKVSKKSRFSKRAETAVAIAKIKLGPESDYNLKHNPDHPKKLEVDGIEHYVN